MSELISRKSVLDKIEKSLLIDELTVGEKAVLSDVATMISLEPTVDTRTPMANIVENIVTSLESEKTVFLGTRTEQTDTILIDDAINIVKQGINNGLE